MNNEASLPFLLRNLLGQVTIRSFAHYEWLGTVIEVGSSPRSPMAPSQLVLEESLKQRLYSCFYCSGELVESSTQGARILSRGSKSFVDALSRANSGYGRWEDGWEVVEVDSSNVRVRKGRLKIWLESDEYSNFSTETQSPLGQLVKIKLPKERLRSSNGFYVAVGEQAVCGRRLRLYWNIRSDMAANLVKNLTTSLNTLQLPFTLKVLNHPMNYDRCDAGVLYISKEHYRDAWPIVAHTWDTLSDSIGESVPMFTEKLASGLGAAEDPGDGKSFGLHRCDILAKAMVQAFLQGAVSLEDRYRFLESGFALANVSLDKPFLTLDSDSMHASIEARTASADLVHKTAQPINLTTAYDCLSIARRIGDRLQTSAFWHEQNCTWIATIPDRQEDQALYRDSCALGADLGGGTSGIALFLVELFRATRENVYRHLGLGAISNALTRANQLVSRQTGDIYSGWIGVALSAILIGKILEDPVVLKKAKTLTANALEIEMGSWNQSRLRIEDAGLIVGLLNCYSLIDPDDSDIELVAASVRLASELLKCEEVSNYLKRDAALPDSANEYRKAVVLACALANLHVVTGDSMYRSGALRAYEIIERIEAELGRRSLVKVARSYLYGYQALGEPNLGQKAYRLMPSVLEDARRSVLQGTRRLSLDDGLIGQVELLLSAATSIGYESAELPWIMERTQHLISRQRLDPNDEWNLDHPGLLAGWSGLGYFCLRLSNEGSSRLPIPF